MLLADENLNSYRLHLGRRMLQLVEMPIVTSQMGDGQNLVRREGAWRLKAQSQSKERGLLRTLSAVTAGRDQAFGATCQTPHGISC